MSQTYDEQVEEIARGILIENGLWDRHWYDAVTEAVEAEKYDAATVLKESSNEPDSSELGGMLSEDDKSDWRAIQNLAAFLAMERDVQQKLHELKDDYIECDDCNIVVLQEESHDHTDGMYCSVCHKKRFRADIGTHEDVPVIYHTHELDDVDNVPLHVTAGDIAQEVMKGKTPIGILLDLLEEDADMMLTDDKQLKKDVVEYLRKKYPIGHEEWVKETFLTDPQDNPVRDDMPHENDDYYAHSQSE